MRVDRNIPLIFFVLFPALMLSCSVKRKGQCYSCFDSTTSVEQLYLDSSQATFLFEAKLNPESQFKIVLAPGRDFIDTVEEADIASSEADVTVVSDWSSSIDLALLDNLLPDQNYAMALLEKNKFERIRIMEIKEFSTQSADSPKAAGVPKVLQVKKEAATIVVPSALDDKSLATEMSYLVVVWKKEIGPVTKDDILQNKAGIKVVKDWTQGTDQETQEFQISNLEVETDYVVGILARDADGNVTLMPLRSLKTLDQSAPDADAIALVSSTESSVVLGWPQAQDDETSADRLEYRVLMSRSLNSLENPNILNELESGSSEPRVLQDWTPNLTQFEATGLEIGLKYHFAVIVRDLGKNIATFRTLSTTISDPDAPVFQGDSIEILPSSTGYRYPDGVQVIWYANVVHKSSIATDATTPADEIEYLAACSVDSSALASLETIQSNPGKVTRSSWQKAARLEADYSITLDPRDEKLRQWCGDSRRMDFLSSMSFRAQTPELKDVSPNLMSNVCAVLKKYEVNPRYSIERINSFCQYSGVAGKIYAKIFARDAEGKTTSLGPKLLAYTLDTDAPRFSENPVLNSDGTLSWTPATDFFTTQANIEYRVVAAPSSDTIDSVEEVTAIASAEAGLVLDWTANISSTQLNITATSSIGSIVLAARDDLGNVRLAAAVNIADEVPVAGTALSLSNFVFNSLLVSWGAATDDKTAAADLSYKLVRAATASDLDTATKAIARSASDVLLDWTKATTSYELTGAQLATGAFAVLVRDSVGQIALYDPISRSAAVSSLELYFDAGNTASYPGTGTNWMDLSGNGFDSTLSGGVAFDASNGGVFDFDGVNDYVLLGNRSALKPTTAISISQWLAPDNWTGLAEFKPSISCTQGAGYAILITTSDTIQFQVLANGSYRTASTSTAAFTGWKFIVGVFDGRYSKIYVNGALAHTVDAGGTYPITYIQNGIFIGAEATNNDTPHTANWWAGKIGPTLIRSRAMTDAEVLAEFNASRSRFGL